jgi:hypothetical protein
LSGICFDGGRVSASIDPLRVMPLPNLKSTESASGKCRRDGKQCRSADAEEMIKHRHTLDLLMPPACLGCESRLAAENLQGSKLIGSHWPRNAILPGQRQIEDI